MDWHVKTSPGFTAALVTALVTILGAAGRMVYKFVKLPRAMAAEKRKEAAQLFGDKQKAAAEVARLQAALDECVSERSHLRERERALGVNLEGARVIVVEDDPLYAKMLGLFLVKLGMVVVAETGSGREAVTLALERRPDVVIMDLSLIDLDGIEATRQIVADWPAARILILSGSADQEEIEAAREAGASWVLVKGSVNLQGLMVALMAAKSS